ncbi:MAG: helix-turn-helix domain-containing protein [Bacillaceae bacterium]
MAVNELHYLILYCVDKINGERTIASVYHLLNGKRSGQTIQDGHLFQFLFLFSLFKGLKEKVFYQYVEELVEKDFLLLQSEKVYVLSEKGHKEVGSYYEQNPLPNYLNGYEYGEDGKHFWKHINLLIQTLSYLQYEEKKFIPIEENTYIQTKIKMFLFQQSFQSINEVASCVKKELEMILQQCTPTSADIFVARLTGYKRAGLTYTQIGQRRNKNVYRTYIEFVSVLHKAVHEIRFNDDIVQLKKLYEFHEHAGLSQSTKVTYTLIKQGYTIEQIALKRKLKQSTIEDHIVEIMVHTGAFHLHTFVSSEEHEMIKHAVITLRTNKLKKIKEYVGDSVSYFAIRLVLAKEGEKLAT